MKKVGVMMAAGVGAWLAAAGEVPRPEHPRPDAVRENWLTLNGEWQFESDAQGDGEARGLITGKELASKITVPFCPESKLSGLALGNTEYLKNLWYRRMLEVPAAMKGKRILLHFGGVDYASWVYVNGRLAGTHVGGSAAFGFEISDFLRDGLNEVVVRVSDDLRGGLQPGGKQAYDKSQGCVYTRTTGIWQTVWLEAVGSSYVERFSVVPDPERARVLIEAAVNGADAELELKGEAFADGKRVGADSAKGAWRNRRLVLDLAEKRLWEPGAPFLYDLTFTLTSRGKTVDVVRSYFGLRSVAIEGRRILINGKPVFQRTVLDQGFYPDGIWTAPTDAALKGDIELSQACGYNGARLHQKVFEPRFLYWADKLGYLVWGEFPNWGYNYKPEGYAPYVAEWTEILLRDRNHPSVIGWCPFNETPASAGELQQLVWNVTRAVDPTRPVLETSGWSHTLALPEVRDAHDYDANPEALRARWEAYFSGKSAGAALPLRYGHGYGGDPAAKKADCGVPFMISEFGGIGWATEGGWGYGTGPKTLDEFYARYKGQCDAQLDNPNLFGFCYTQLTDVEQEHNGLYYYDRRPKFDVKRLHAITSRQAAYERGEPPAPQPERRTDTEWKVLVGAQQDGALCTPFRYVTQTPQGEWAATAYDDSAWPSGLAPFGTEGKRIGRTPWTTPDIYLRKTFEYSGAELKAGAVVLTHDEDTEVYVNGQKILGVQGFIGNYAMRVVTEELRKALRKGTNTLAVHTRQTSGGQFIDLALLVY